MLLQRLNILLRSGQLAFFGHNYLGQRVRCDEKFDGRDHTYIPFGVPVYDRGAWDGGSFLETDPGNVDAGV